MHFQKIIQGSFNQGNSIFGESAGKQCACISLYAACFSTYVKQPGNLSTCDIDFIMNGGDKLYRSLNKSTYLMVSDLPHSITVFDSNIKVTYLENETGFLNGLATMQHFLLYSNSSSRADAILFFIKTICISIVPRKNCVYLFDSHSRDISGKPSTDGHACLIKFRNKKEVEFYLHTTYVNDCDLNVQYEVQYISFDKEDNSDFAIIYSSEINKQRLATEGNKEKTRKRMATEANKEKTKKRMATEANKEKTKKRMASEINKERTKKRAKVRKETTAKCNLKIDDEQVRGQDDISMETCSTSDPSYTSNYCIQKFQNAIQNGPYYICKVCNRCLYKKTVKLFHKNAYKMDVYHLLTDVNSFDSKSYICLTCHKYLKKSETPPQAVWNKLALVDLPSEIKCLNRLEKILISKRILFKKVAVMHGKGEQQKIKGSICNIPIQVESVCNCLPHGIDSSGIIFVKLKRKLIYRGHVVFEKVRPDFLIDALFRLKAINPFYSDTLINVDNITQELLTLTDTDALVEHDEFSISFANNEEDSNLEIENPLSSNCSSSDELCVIPNFHNPEEEVLHIAPGENKKPQSFFTDQYCEELAFPFLFPTGKFGYKVTRPVNLTITKYFNQRLLNYSQRFSSNADYIFFAHYIIQQASLFDQINIATKKVKGSITASQLQINFEETVKSFICENQGYQFMKTIKGTPAYWKNFLYDVLAMVKQLGLPSYFLTLSCADLRWDELVMIIAKLNNIDANIEEMDYFTRCNILNQNPVLTARHFQYRVENFFKEILLHPNSPIGKVENYVIKVEFQFRGSPHIHAFLWLKDTPTLDNVHNYLNFVDGVIRTDLPDSIEEPELHELVLKYQIHSHSNSCRKYKNVPCRFNYGRFFTDHTIAAVPLPEETPDAEKIVLLTERAKILKKVKLYIDENLHPCKPNFFKDSSCKIPEILEKLGISVEEYYRALAISPNEDVEIHYRRPPNSCFVNNYFAVGLMAWKANLDLQPVFNYYKAVSYMCSYFSKTETECSMAMKKAAEECDSLNFQERMKKMALVFLSHRQCSLQEAVYQVLPELWLRKCYPGVVFANTNLPEKRYRLCKSKTELEELSPDSIDVFKRNSLDRYIDRPNATYKDGKYSLVDELCYAEFLAYYVLDTAKKSDEENDYQPEVLLDDNEDDNHLLLYLPKCVPIMGSKEKLRRRNKKRVIRYHTPNPVSKPEEYAHHLLLLFLPFRQESDLLLRNSYVQKLNDLDILNVINENKRRFEPWGDLVDQVLMNGNFTPRTDAYAQQENDDVIEVNNGTENELYESQDTLSESEFNNRSGHVTTTIDILPDEDINTLIRTLNEKQRQVFEIVNKWSRTFVKNLSAKQVTANPPLNLFITGGAGTGKSHLIKTITAAVSKTLSYGSSCIEKPTVLLLAPTGVAAVNINGTTIHSGLGISVESKGLTVNKISDKKLSKLRQELSDVKVIIIDEISMVSNKLLLYIHQRLIKIFGSVNDFKTPFAGLTMILVGDLYQLPPVMQPTIYAEFKGDSTKNIHPLWRYFQMCELTEVMRQRGDTVLIDLLNNIRLGILTFEDENLLQSRFIEESNPNYPQNALHIFAENEPARVHNTRMLNTIADTLITIDAIDQVPNKVPNHVYNRILNLDQAKTGGLAFQLSLKKGAKVMLTSNIDISDKLINGQIGTVTQFLLENNFVKVVYVAFDNENVGKNKIKSDRQAQHLNAVPIERTTTEIRTQERINTSPVIKRTQFPLKLSWACTVHKVQGLSLNEIVISFQLFKQRLWNSGQMYVALSRVTSISGLYLAGKFDTNAITVNDQTKREYQYLRENQSLNLGADIITNDIVLSIFISNVRSLRKHILDISCDKKITSCDMIFCTETQMISTEKIEEVSINDFELTCNIDSQHKFSSLAIFYKKSYELKEHFKLNGFSMVEFSNANLPKVKILLLYKKKDLPAINFFETLRYLTASNNIDIVIGDFNLSPDSVFVETFNNYTQYVTEPTHIGGSILDHCYVHNAFYKNFNVIVTVKSLFFSDHEGLKICFTKKH